MYRIWTSKHTGKGNSRIGTTGKPNSSPKCSSGDEGRFQKEERECSMVPLHQQTTEELRKNREIIVEQQKDLTIQLELVDFVLSKKEGIFE